MKPDGRILDANLRLLLTRAYVPALPRPDFRALVEDSLRREMQRKRRPARASKPRAWPLLATGAAAAGLAAAALLARSFLSSGLPSEKRYPTAEEVFSSARVAIRDGPLWRAANEQELARGVALGAAPLDLALSEGASLELLAPEPRGGRGGRLRARGAARLSFEALPTVAGALELGELSLERPELRPSELPWKLRTPSGELSFSSGMLEVACQRDLERFLLLQGSASFTENGAQGGTVALVAGEEFRLPRRPEVSTLAAGMDAPDPGRRPVAEPDSDKPPQAPVGSASASLLGTVHAADGSALSRFRVALLRERVGNDFEPPLVRDFDGDSFRWEGIPPGRYQPFVWAEGYALATLDALDVALPESEPTRIEVRLQVGGMLRGRVVDERGDGVAGALVLSERDTPQHVLLFNDADRIQWLPASTRTRADGSFELAALSAGTHSLRATAIGYAPAWASGLQVPDGGFADAVELRLSRGGGVEGRAERPDGSPWSEAPIIVTPIDESRHPQMNTAETETDAEGRYLIEDLPLGHVLVILVDRSQDRPIVKPAEIRVGETATIDFLSESTGTRLSGRLLDEEGQPIARENLALYSKPTALDGDYGDFNATSSASDGTFVFDDLQPGSYLLYQVGQMGRSLRFIGEIDVPSVPSLEHEFRMRNGALSGTVGDARNGAPVSDALLILEVVDPATGESFFGGISQTDASGGFSIDRLNPGRYRIVVHALNGELGHERSDEVVLTELEPRTTVDFMLAEGGSIEIRAVDPEGRAIEKASVLFVDEAGVGFTFSQFPLTDEDGVYVAYGVRPGRYRVILRAPGYSEATLLLDCLALERASARVVLAPEHPLQTDTNDGRPPSERERR